MAYSSKACNTGHQMSDRFTQLHRTVLEQYHQLQQYVVIPVPVRISNSRNLGNESLMTTYDEAGKFTNCPVMVYENVLLQSRICIGKHCGFSSLRQKYRISFLLSE